MDNEYTGLKVSTFKDRFSELCESDPLNASAIADKLHVSRQTISAWKSGYRSPKEPTIISIANHFNVKVEWLMGFDVEKMQNAREVLERAFSEYQHGMELKKQFQADLHLFGDDHPRTPEARILAKGIDKMPPEQRKALVNLMEGLYPGVFETEKGTDNDDT